MFSSEQDDRLNRELEILNTSNSIIGVIIFVIGIGKASKCLLICGLIISIIGIIRSDTIFDEPLGKTISIGYLIFLWGLWATVKIIMIHKRDTLIWYVFFLMLISGRP